MKPQERKTNKRCGRLVLIAILLIWLSFFLFQKINLATADLGRFLKNGEYILQGDWKILKTNFFSYTYPNYPFLNHHWLTGVVFYLFYKIGDFSGLQLFLYSLIFAAFVIVFKISQKETDSVKAASLSLLIIPLIAYRNELRPEIFSSLFAVLFFYILWKYKNNSLSSRWLFVLPLIEIFWVNLHIYFFLGICIIGAFLLEKIIIFLKNKKDFPKQLSLVFFLSILATLINPFGLRGALEPLFIYNNYGYRVLDEQSIWFLQNLNINNPTFTLFKIILIALIFSFILALIKKPKKFSLVNLFLAAGFAFMSILQVRNISLFALFAIPILAGNIGAVFPKIKINNNEQKLFFAFLLLVMAIIIASSYNNYLPINTGQFGIGLMERNTAAAEFFKENHLKGPIFNNYDIGGYLIYFLFPKEKVFVDNRPESYPSSFFQNVYIPMQKNENIWQKEDEKYNFNAIFFYRNDATPWAQPFLIKRIEDPNWAPVFVDAYNIIFLKRNETNKELIAKYEIPKDNFIITHQ